MNNPQAFPSHGTMGEVVQEGMTLRDYFAGQALSNILMSQYVNPYHSENHAGFCKSCYEIADAMLKERSK